LGTCTSGGEVFGDYGRLNISGYRGKYRLVGGSSIKGREFLTSGGKTRKRHLRNKLAVGGAFEALLTRYEKGVPSEGLRSQHYVEMAWKKEVSTLTCSGGERGKNRGFRLFGIFRPKVQRRGNLEKTRGTWGTDRSGWGGQKNHGSVGGWRQNCRPYFRDVKGSRSGGEEDSKNTEEELMTEGKED